MKISKEFKIGFFFIVAVALLVWGFNFLKGKQLWSKERKFYAVYGNVGGLEKTKPIYINGVKVGQVGDVYFDPKLNGDIIVELDVTHKFPIPRNSVAKIFSEDLMGSRAIDLRLGTSQELAQNGDTLQSDVEATLKESVNAQIAPIKAKAEDLISSIDTMVAAVQAVFNKDIREELLKSIRSIRHTFQNFESTSENIDTMLVTQSGRISNIIYNLDMITSNLRDNGQQITAILTNVADLSDTLAHANISNMLNNLDKAINDLSKVTSRIENGEGTLGMLVSDDKLYKELEKAAFELNQLLEDIRVNPKRYVRFSVF